MARCPSQAALMGGRMLGAMALLMAVGLMNVRVRVHVHVRAGCAGRMIHGGY